MFREVAAGVDFPALERDVLGFWKEHRAFDTRVAKNRAARPAGRSSTGRSRPTAQWACTPGAPRTATCSSAKGDGGHDLRYQNGFDCQGLWVEVEVEKELGSKSKGISKPMDRPVRRGVQGAGAALRPDADPAVRPPGVLDGLGQLLLHHVRREQLHHSALPQEVPRAGADRGTTPCRGARGAPPVSRSTRSPRRATKRSPIRPCSSSSRSWIAPGVAHGVDDDALDAGGERRRRGTRS